MSYRIAVMGTGGVGGYFGARLAQAGSDVTFIARGPHLAAIQRDGLKVESPNGNLLIAPAKAVASPAGIDAADAIIFAVKMGDTENAAQALLPLVAKGAAIFTFQNGVDSAERIGAIVGHANVVPGTAAIAAVIAAPGVIKHSGTMARLVFGEPDGNPSARCVALLAACTAAGFDVVKSDGIVRAVWLKFALLAPFSGMTALTRGPIGPIRDNGPARRLLETAVAEAVAVGMALRTGLEPADVARTLKLIDSMPAGMTSSMCHDLMAGKPLEIAGLSGAVARLGQTHNVATPTHDFIASALAVHALGTPR